MTIDSTTLAACKAYMRVDGNDEDSTITMLMESASAYLDSAGAGNTEDFRYPHALYALTLHSYDHRNDIEADVPLPAALRNLITQLKLEPTSDGTGTML